MMFLAAFHSALRALNRVVGAACGAIAIVIVAVMALALSASAATRFTTGIGYDWLIELPPMLTPWLVFPLMGPLYKSGSHITVDVIGTYLSSGAKRALRMLLAVIVVGASAVFATAASEAVALFMRLGQVVELEIKFPIWWLYFAFPTGFTILALFAVEQFLADAIGAEPERASP